MLGEHLADLDELVLHCRDEKAKAYIAEALACYRACIVTTWIAVVFDFIHKLCELELTGDKQAQERLQKLENVQMGNDIRASLVFEREVLDLARDKFEFLSALEYDDLKRLFDDRNRCAHPSMQSWDEPYQPPGELARYHLRNAVLHLLQRPPIQGKAALERIWAEIRSVYFPTDVGVAIEHFRHGPLARAREPLVRGVIMGLTKSLLLEHLPQVERARPFSALRAVLQMYVAVGEKVLYEDLPKVILRVSDTEWANVIDYVRYIPSGWEALGEPGRIKARTFMVSSLPEVVAPAVGSALHIAELREIAIERVQELSNDALAAQLRLEPLHEYADVAIERFAKARSFDEGNKLARSLLLPVAPLLTLADIRRTLNVFLGNGQLYGSSGTIDVIGEIFKLQRRYAEELRDDWMQLYKNAKLTGWRRGEATTRSGRLYEGHPLLNMIEEAFPEVVGSVSGS